jgi:hypothetical protein
MFWTGAVCLCSLWVSGCEKSPSLADQLSPSSGVTVESLTITVNPPPVGRTVQASARATFSNGASTAIAGGFVSDTPGVATATTGGLITGVAVGDVTISLDYSGAHASKTVHVLPAYDGIWAGTYVIDSCTQTEGFETANFCGPFTAGLSATIAFSSTQVADLTTITGQFALGSALGVGNGTVSPTGTLTYNGAITGTTTRMELRNFTAMSPSVGRMTGSFEQVWTDSATSGQALVVCRNLDVTRTSAPAAAALSTPSSPAPKSLTGLAALIFK